MLTTKYYSFTDKITGELTKGLGHSYEYQGQNIRVRFHGGKAHVQKNEIVNVVHEITPVGLNLKEITKEDFDILDTSNESFTSKLIRERSTVQAVKKETWIEKLSEPLTTEELEAKLDPIAKDVSLSVK